MNAYHPVPCRKTLLLLGSAWLLLWGASVSQDLTIFLTGAEDKIWILDVDSEESLYTWFSTILLGFAGLLAFVLGSRGTGALEWRVIGSMFLAMSVDEMLSLHERLSGLLSGYADASGPFLFVWVLPALALVALVAFVFLPFLRRLPRRAAIVFAAGAVLFVAGAIGLEMVAGVFLSGEDELTKALSSPSYRILTNLEEGLEALGVISMIAGLLMLCVEAFPATFSMD